MKQREDSGPQPSWMAGLEPLSRRGFLRASVITGAAVTAGCSTLVNGVLGKDEAPEKLQYRYIKPDQARTLRRLATVMIPSTSGLPSPLTDVPTLDNLDGMISQMGEETRELVALAIWTFEHRPVLSLNFSDFSSMNYDQALAYVRDMQHGNFIERGVTTTLKTLVTINYWRDSDTWPALDYWGEVTRKWGITSLGNAPLPPT